MKLDAVGRSTEKNAEDSQAKGRLALLLALRQVSELKRLSHQLEQERNNRAYHHVTYDIACVFALAGKSDEAVKWLRTTADTGMPNYPLFARDPHLNRIRKAPAFNQFMTELKTRWTSYQGELSN